MPRITKRKKNICIFFDGTWMGIASQPPSNVVQACRLVASQTPSGDSQLVFHIDGVGVGQHVAKLEKKYEKNRAQSFFDTLTRSRKVSKVVIDQEIEKAAAALGTGVIDRIVRAYGNLVWNYDPGDRIFVFGFSRGAFAARAFASLIRHSGIVSRGHLERVPEAVSEFLNSLVDDSSDLSKMDDFKRSYCDAYLTCDVLRDRVNQNALQEDRFRDLDSSKGNCGLSIRYLGLWDTVSASIDMSSYPAISDNIVSRCVESLRHVLAFHENRPDFFCKTIANVSHLNNIAKTGDPLYSQVWSPGDHTGVGGGSDHNPSIAAFNLLWVLEGAQKMGLALECSDQIRESISTLLHFDTPSALPGARHMEFPSRPQRLSQTELAEIGIAPFWKPYLRCHGERFFSAFRDKSGFPSGLFSSLKKLHDDKDDQEDDLLDRILPLRKKRRTKATARSGAAVKTRKARPSRAVVNSGSNY